MLFPTHTKKHRKRKPQKWPNKKATAASNKIIKKRTFVCESLRKKTHKNIVYTKYNNPSFASMKFVLCFFFVRSCRKLTMCSHAMNENLMSQNTNTHTGMNKCKQFLQTHPKSYYLYLYKLPTGSAITIVKIRIMTFCPSFSCCFFFF